MTSPINDKEKVILQQLSSAFTAIPFNKMLGMKLNVLTTDHVVMSLVMKEELIGNFLHGILHGGVISSVLDMCGGMVVMASTIHRHPDASIEELVEIVGKCSTVDLHVSYVSPGKGEQFIAKAWLTKTGNKIAFTRMELMNQDENLIATGNGTYFVR